MDEEMDAMIDTAAGALPGDTAQDVNALVAEVRRLNRVVAELKAEFGSITRNARRAERELHIAEVRRLQTELADLQYGYDGLANAILVEGGENLLRKARREERERCAKTVESLITRSLLTGEGTSYDGVRGAVAMIRALPDEERK